jgi:hypothetical protein
VEYFFDPVIRIVIISFAIGVFAGCAMVHGYQLAADQLVVEVRWR